jgi:hypothetical protein
VIVGVVTDVPAGHLLEPLDVNVTSAPSAVDTPYRSESQARTWTSDALAATDGSALL